MNIPHLAIAITFHYNENRLEFLEKITSAHRYLADRVTTFIITNANSSEQIEHINIYSKAQHQTIVTQSHIGHPFLLPWCHRSVFSSLIKSDSSVSHFLYTEDDILLTIENVNYWLRLSPFRAVANLRSMNVFSIQVQALMNMATRINTRLARLRIRYRAVQTFRLTTLKSPAPGRTLQKR